MNSSILAEVQDAVYRTDRDGNIIWYSPSALKIMKYSSDDSVASVHVRDFYANPEDREKFLARMTRDGKVTNYEIRLRRGDGKIISASFNASYVRDKNGEIVGTQGVFRDITQIKETEKALSESEARFRNALKDSFDILYQLNLESNTYEYISSSVSNISGFTSEEVIAMGPDWVNSITHPDDLKFMENYRYKLIADDAAGISTGYIEYRLKNKNGDYFWMGDSHSLIKDKDGTPKFIIGSARDITDRKKIEESLRHSEYLNRKTLNSIDEAIHVSDTDFKIILMNNTLLDWCRDFNLDLDYQGKNIFEHFPFLGDDVRRQYLKVLETGETLMSSEEVRFGDHTKTTETRKIPILENGKVSRIVTVIRDITDQRRAEAARYEAELRFIEVLNNSQDILYRLNLKTNKYDYMSSSVLKITGYTRDEVLAAKGDAINTITHPNDLNITGNYRKTLIDKSPDLASSQTLEYRIKHKDGYYIWLGDSHSLIRDRNGEALYIIGSARDITERRLSEIRQQARINLLDNLRGMHDIDACLNFGCRATYEANLFERAVLTIHNDKREIVNIGYFGLDPETMAAAKSAPPPDDNLIDKMTQDKFRIGHSYFIPAESGVLFKSSERYLLQDDFPDVGYSTWQTGDELFVPIKGSDGKYEGWLSVDTPFDRKRPTRETIRLLEETVDIVTQKIREIRYLERFKSENLALQASESRFRELFEGSAEGILVADPITADFKYANPAICEMLNYSRKELENLSVRDIHPKESIDYVLSEFDLQSRGLKKTSHDLPCLTKDGRILYADVTAAVINIDGKDHAVGFFTDITDRKNMTDALKQSEEFSRAIIEYSPIGVSVRSNTGRLISYNKTWRDIWAFTDDEIKERMNRIRPALKFDERDTYLGRWLPEVEKIYKIGGYLHVTDIHIPNRRNRGEIWISQHFYAITDDHGKVDRVVILTDDITEQKKNQREREASEQRYQELFNSMQEGVALIDENEVIILCNPAYLNILEAKSADEIIGRSLNEFIPDEQKEILATQIKRRREKISSQYEITVETIKGNHRTLYVSGAPNFDDSGKYSGTFAAVIDITESKRAEEKIKNINKEKLEQAKRIAGTFAHEIRNALFPAGASLHKLKSLFRSDQATLDALENYTKIAEQSIVKAADITRLISTYTKLETEIIPESVDLRIIFDELLKLNQMRIAEEKVDIKLSGNNCGPVRSNRKQLLLVLNNLMINSLDALDGRDNKRIEISWKNIEDSVEIIFSDNGDGIPAENIENIFEPFFSMKSDIGGTGLGLAMAKRIVEMYGGRISARSEKGRGTDFLIKLKPFDLKSGADDIH